MFSEPLITILFDPVICMPVIHVLNVQIKFKP